MIDISNITHIFQLPLEWLRAVHARCFKSFPGTGMRMTEQSDGAMEFAIDEEQLASFIAQVQGNYVTTDTAQTVSGQKTFGTDIVFPAYQGLKINASGGALLQFRGFGSNSTNQFGIFFDGQTSRLALAMYPGESTPRLVLGSSFMIAVELHAVPSDSQSTTSKQVAVIGWVNDKFIRKISDGTGLLLSSSGTVTLAAFAGTGSANTPARSDHNHDNTYAKTADLGTAATKNVGTGQNDVAAGVHSHTKSQITDFPAFGTGQNDIARGNHTHTKSQITDFPTVPSAASQNPKDLGDSAAKGASTAYAREDHVHKKPDITDLKYTDASHSGYCLLIVDNSGNVTHSGNAYYTVVNSLVNGTFTLQDRSDSPADAHKTVFYRGAILLFASSPRIEFHYNDASAATSKIQETASGVLTVTGSNLLLSAQPCTDPGDTTNYQPLQVATVESVDSIPAKDPSSYTNINLSSSSSATADSTTWTAGNSNGKGLKINQCVRVCYDTTGNTPVLYAYYRTFTYDKCGRLHDITGETRVAIDSTTLIDWS